MKKLVRHLKKTLSVMLLATMIFTMISPVITAQAAVGDDIEIGDVEFDAITGVMKYSSCIGHGLSLIHI